MSRLCARAGMSRQNHYRRKARRTREEVDGELVGNLVRRERQIQPRLGARKLHHMLKNTLVDNGIKIGRDRFFKLMGRSGLLLEALPKAPRTTMSRHNLPHYGNRLKDMTLSGPNQAVVSDITYIRCTGRFLYLALITDAFSRKVVGHHLGRLMDTGETLHALEMAVKAQPAGTHPVHHSDRGSQYCSHAYVAKLREHGMGVSMTETNHCAENSMAERLNGILKQEYGLGGTFPDEEAASRAVNQAVRLYNTRRPHYSLDMRCPEQVHRQIA